MKKLLAFVLCFAFLTAAVVHFSDNHNIISHHDAKPPIGQVALLDATLPVVERPVNESVTVIMQKEETALGVVSPVYAVARPPNA